MNKQFFTVVIPAYNCESTIDSLLDSIAANAGDLIVIVVDDSDQEHDISDKVLKYPCELPIIYYKREDAYKIHCPGNTRHSGLQRALLEDTQYILFVDCDDELYGDRLPKLKDTLIENGMPDVVCTRFDVFDPNGNFVRREPVSLGWLHGKLWRKDFLMRHTIQFKRDMLTHEDLYFNSLVNYYQIVDGTTPANATDDLIFYKWHQREDSFTHKDYDGIEEIYIQKYFDEYVYADIDIYMDRALVDGIDDPDIGGKLAIRCAHSIYSAYCYFQAFQMRGKQNRVRNAYIELKKSIWKYYQTFGMGREDLIRIIYSDPKAAINHRTLSYTILGYYIEQESFKDFINGMRFYE